MFTKLFTVKLSDWQRALIIAILTGPLTIIYDTISIGSLTFDWKKIITIAITGGIGYVLKNLLTGQNGNMLTNK